ncbi:ferredoxin oxidoreductase [Pseudooceanicola lipolyticus]|uniref:Ferredoxin oxidoreductase n=1 Tax=Pseudooceanicola lipolyticus TaxID=2029104 RepID=A0A2M8J466_9RHOB|nr:2Fe-2S iron-sulfur cluster binding domain-containing protein [Pseudooceanicola lipolyticus]MCC0027250.1 2Fe-2S iron-sulfur cluster binding domain-containing protein [Brucellaceae bacterium]PJE37579.1 ferredoxin oxidoreductase [Pseudooceanicola lipolyticus]
MSYTVTIVPDGPSFDAQPEETLLEAARRAGVAFPHECGWGSCGTCKVTLVSGDTELLFPDAPAINPRDVRTGRIVACQSMARSDLTIRLSPAAPPQLPVPDRLFETELVSVEDLAPEIRRFTFRAEEDIDFLPGQYAILHLGPGLRRAYSMCNLPGEGVLQVISKRYSGGSGSEALAAMATGDRLTLEAPFGTCTLNRSPGRKVFIAGGTGISPILALVRQVAREGVDFAAPVDVIYCARRPEDLAASAELSDAVDRVAGASCRLYAEDCTGQPAVSSGRATEAIAETRHDPAETEFYVAGPPVMVNAVKAHLKEAGVPITRVRYDSFG